MNLNDPQRRSQWPFLLFLFILALIFFALDNRGSLGLGVIQEPLIGLTQRFSGINDRLRQPADMQAALREIEVLQERVALLEEQNAQLVDVQSEYVRLLQLLGRVQEAPNFERVTASVIGRGSNPDFRDLIIDRGSDHGVRVGMPVESTRGLVGQVIRTTPNASLVLLVTDASSAVPVRLSQSRALGVLVGGGEGGLMRLEGIDPEVQLMQNDVVMTAGLQSDTANAVVSNRFPADVVVGRVIEIYSGEAELFQSALVQSVVDIDTLETVFVITDFSEVNPEIFESEN